ncbi:unnamed protein product [Pieris brassicae]|uniref:Uncharacterized protein n=1 Tax=Pieris brassicae TaxID=7116 RepID=A0A9P0WUA0_PIEBR|nr:unnamed protein product [Pieris brassicae]
MAASQPIITAKKTNDKSCVGDRKAVCLFDHLFGIFNRIGKFVTKTRVLSPRSGGSWSKHDEGGRGALAQLTLNQWSSSGGHQPDS